ncbi:hypothetical protein D9M71_93760 [compost metagenome]
MRQVIGSLEHCRCARHRRIDVAGIAHYFARLPGRRFQRLAVRHRVVAGIRAIVPHDLQRFTPLDRRPGIARHYRHAAQGLEFARQRAWLDLHHLDHSRNLHGCAGIERLDLATIDRRSRYHSMQHTLDFYVSAIHGPPIDDVFTVDGKHAALADVTKLGSRLELQALARRDRQTGSRDGQFTIAKLAAAGLMDNLVQLRAAFALGHLPPLRGGLFEHPPRGRATPPHGVVPMAHAARTVGVLIAVAHLIGGRLPDLDPRPIGIEFIRYHHGQAGAHTLAHFRTVAHHGDAAVGIDTQVHTGVVDPAVRHAVGTKQLLFGTRVLPAPAGGQQQCTTCPYPLEKAAPAQVTQGEIVDTRIHALPSGSWLAT